MRERIDTRGLGSAPPTTAQTTPISTQTARQQSSQQQVLSAGAKIICLEQVGGWRILRVRTWRYLAPKGCSSNRPPSGSTRASEQRTNETACRREQSGSLGRWCARSNQLSAPAGRRTHSEERRAPHQQHGRDGQPRAILHRRGILFCVPERQLFRNSQQDFHPSRGCSREE
jgi:hypothetical protein